MPSPIIGTVDKAQFGEFLRTNPGLVILKLGATWCGPCKQIEKQVYECIGKMQNNVQSIIIDIDDSFEIYSFLKTKKMVNGIPAILCYEKGNTTYIPTHSVLGSDIQQVRLFFQQCYDRANQMLAEETHKNLKDRLERAGDVA
jgi:thiol-disulfide isomerase/thioredoxin